MRSRTVKWPTVARARLAAWQAEDPKRRNQTEIAKALDVKASTVSRWVSGDARPDDGAMRTAIERLTGIPAVTWKTADERAADDALVARAAAAGAA